MNNLIKAELYKFKKNFYIWIILFIMILCYLPSLFGNTTATFELLLKGVEKDVMVMLIGLSIYSGLTISNDFSNRTILHYISGGHRRSHIIFVEFLSFYLTCILIIVLYPTILLIISSLILSFPFLSNIDILLYSVIKSIILYSGLIGIFFLVSISTKKGTVSMGTSITLSILSVVLSNKLYTNPNSLWRLNPLIQLQNNNGFTSEIIISCLISLLLLLISLAISIKIFSKSEIR
ncbi:hypothetical protein [Thomasclavelia sp.]